MFTSNLLERLSKRNILLVGLSVLIFTQVIGSQNSAGMASGPDEPEQAAPNLLWRIGGRTEAVAVQGDYAYLAQADSVKVVYLPTMSVKAAVQFPTQVMDVVANGSYAYAITTSYGDLYSLDISNPEAPAIAGKGEALGWMGGHSLVVRGGYAYVLGSTPTDGLVTFSLADPAVPAYVTKLTGVSGRWLRAGANHLYGLRWDRLMVFDLSSPSSPALLTTYARDSASGLFVAEPYVYLSELASQGVNSGYGLTILNVANPASPQETGAWVYSTEMAGSADGIAVSGTTAYLGINDRDGDFSGLYVLDVSDRANPKYLSRTMYRESYDYFNLSDTRLVIVGGNDGNLSSFDLSDPSSWLHSPTLFQPGYAYLLRRSGNQLYLLARADHYGRRASLWVFDLSDPLSPQIVWQLDNWSGEVLDMELANGLVYMAGPGYGVQAFNVSNFDPRGSYIPYGVTSYSPDIELYGTLLYALAPYGSGEDRFDVLSFANPDAPVLVASRTTTAFELRTLKRYLDRLYLLDFASGCLVYGLNNPAAPALLGDLNLPNITAFEPAGDRLYVTAGMELRVLDVSDPANYTTLGTLGLSSTNACLETAGAGVAVGCYPGLRLVSAFDPANPATVWSTSASAAGSDVLPMLPYLAAAESEMGLGFYATADGAVLPAGGDPLAVGQSEALLVTFTQPMSTASVGYSCNPNPGGWTATWIDAAGGEAVSGRRLLLQHNDFTPGVTYHFTLSSGETGSGEAITPFSLDFTAVRRESVYLPVVDLDK